MADVDVDVLRRAAARLQVLPARPWRAVELTDTDLHGPPAWDPDVQPSADAHARDVERSATVATWRGITDADGTPLVGHPLPGGSAPQPVAQPIWRFLADAPVLLEQVLDQARTLWRATTDTRPPHPAPDPQPHPAAAEAAVITPQLLEVAARAAHAAVPEPGPSWDGLPEPARQQWRDRARAALQAAGLQAPSP